MSLKKIMIFILFVITATIVAAQEQSGIDPEALIDRIVAVEKNQREKIRDVVYDAEYFEGETNKEGEFVEKIRIHKKISLKYFPDTILYHEEFLEFYEKGELQSEEKRDKEVRDREEKKQKRKARDISQPMHTPFFPENREQYTITYQGVAEEAIGEYVCHHFLVDALEEKEGFINGDYYFEAESFRLVQVDFQPAKLVRKTFFKMHELRMSLLYAETPEGYWLPRQFDIQGKGKAMFFIGVKFAGTEYYRNAVVNDGVDDSLFEVEDGS